MAIDLISDMLTRLRNASLARHSSTLVCYSKINLDILKILREEGYITNYLIDNKKKLNIIVFLNYKGWWIKKPLFSTIKRISKPGCRIFSKYENISSILSVLKHSQGIAIISTSSGIMSNLTAKKLKKGGEILCFIE